MRFENKVVLITGAAGGIGKAAAMSFAREGARLGLVDLDPAALEATAKELNLKQGSYLLVPADVTKEEQVQAYVRKVKDAFGRIDVFFNNAGVEGIVANVTDYPIDVFDRIMEVNLKGVFMGLKYVLRIMVEQKSGSIINTSSVAGIRGLPGTCAYNASKWAVIGMTKTTAVECANAGVRVNAICPGLVNTRMMRSLEKGFDPDDPEAAKRTLSEKVPLGRYSEPEEIAEAVLYLASEKASFTTGSVLAVDGGMTS